MLFCKLNDIEIYSYLRSSICTSFTLRPKCVHCAVVHTKYTYSWLNHIVTNISAFLANSIRWRNVVFFSWDTRRSQWILEYPGSVVEDRMTINAIQAFSVQNFEISFHDQFAKTLYCRCIEIDSIRFDCDWDSFDCVLNAVYLC